MRTLLLTVIGLFLVGCSSTKVQEVIVVKEVYQTTDLPNQFKTKCVATKPLKENEFNKLTKEQQDEYLVKYSIQLLADIKKCEVKRNAIVNYLDKHNKIVKELNLQGEK